MRFADLKIGAAYRLVRTHRAVKVIVLETPAATVTRGLVRVEFADGVNRGRITEQPLRCLEAEWGQPKKQRSSSKSSTRRGKLAYVEPEVWPPAAGQQVLWTATTGGLKWKVSKLDPVQPLALLETKIFGRTQTATVRLSELEPVELIRDEPPPRIQRESLGSSTTRFPSPDAIGIAQPQSLIDEYVDALTFSENCLRQYQAMYAPRREWSTMALVLADELRRKGKLKRRDPKEFIRIRTRRFDVILPRRPSIDEPLRIDKLVPFSRPSRRPAGRRQPRRQRR